MIKVSVMYPYTEGKSFDFDYYCNHHFSMARRLFGDGFKGAAVEKGLSGPEPGSRPTYVALGHIYFESVESFQACFGPHAAEMTGDLSNYTEIQPIMQVSEVMM
jgi:uncharacterized protein (TIGR02118 family)